VACDKQIDVVCIQVTNLGESRTSTA